MGSSASLFSEAQLSLPFLHNKVLWLEAECPSQVIYSKNRQLTKLILLYKDPFPRKLILLVLFCLLQKRDLMCYCGAENQCFGINGNFSGCLKLFTWLAKPAADRKTRFCCRGKLQVGNLTAGVFLCVFSRWNVNIYPVAQAANLIGC